MQTIMSGFKRADGSTMSLADRYAGKQDVLDTTLDIVDGVLGPPPTAGGVAAPRKEILEMISAIPMDELVALGGPALESFVESVLKPKPAASSSARTKKPACVI